MLYFFYKNYKGSCTFFTKIICTIDLFFIKIVCTIDLFFIKIIRDLVFFLQKL